MLTSAVNTPVQAGTRIEGRKVRPARGVELLRRQTIVPRPLGQTFAFFSDAGNLERLTPAAVGFTILTPRPIAMRVGALIDYRIRIHGVPITWKTEITVWEPPHRFVDVQLAGPYRYWHHEHRFEACAAGTRIIDVVEYRAPLFWITHPLFIRRELRTIFDYRERVMRGVFGSEAAT